MTWRGMPVSAYNPTLEANVEDQKFKTCLGHIKPHPTTSRRKKKKAKETMHGCVRIKHKAVNSQPVTS